MSDRQYWSIYFAENSNLPDKFDDVLGSLKGADYTRNAEIRAAMEMHIALEQVFHNAGMGDAPPQEKRFLVRQALQNELFNDDK